MSNIHQLFVECNSLNIVNPPFLKGLWLNYPSLTFKQEAGASQPFNPAKSICELLSWAQLNRLVSSLHFDPERLLLARC